MSVGSDHHQIHRGVRLERGFGKKDIDKRLAVDFRGLGLEDKPHGRIFIAFVANSVQKGEHVGFGLQLLGRKHFLADFGLRIGDVLDFREHEFGTCSRRQFIDNELPLIAL